MKKQNQLLLRPVRLALRKDIVLTLKQLELGNVLGGQVTTTVLSEEKPEQC
jgi:hypothetical protein